MERRRLAEILQISHALFEAIWRRAVAAPIYFRLPLLVNPPQTFGATALPLRPAERRILFSETSVRCPTAHEVRLVRTRRKKDAE